MKKRLKYYLVGLSIGLVPAAVIQFTMHTSDGFYMASAIGFLLLWWAERKRLVPTAEEVNRPITLFPAQR